MTTIFSNPVALKTGPNTSPPVTIADNVTAVTVTILKWNGQNSCSLGAEWSFDGGTTWGWYQDVGTVTPALLVGKRPNLVIVLNTWRICQCGQPYLPGALGNGITQNHSTYWGWTSQQIAAIFPGQLLHVADPAAFHNPDDQPATGLPLRRVRAQATASGNINTTLQVDTVP